MANPSSSDKWYFTKEQLENTPSRKCGYDAHKELSYRQQAANFIQDMGQKLKVSQLCINTAIVYMHRFYVFHSFTHFPWHQMAAAALFLAAKVEEQPRKLEYVIKVANICRNPRDTNIDLNSERYITQSQDLVFNENVLLQTLGFDVAIDHPHTHVVRCCHLVRASKDLAQTSYFMASNSLHLTTMCIQYKPTVVACFCILVASKWSNWEIPLSNEKKEWYSYVDPTVTAELLQQLTEEFLVIFEACPSRLKDKVMAIPDNITHPPAMQNSPFDSEPKKVIRDDGKDPHLHKSSHHDTKSGQRNDLHKHRSSRPHEAGSSSQQQREREYKERKERERLAAQQKALMGGQSKIPHGHHRPPVDPKLKPHARPQSMGSYQPSNRAEPRDILRETSRDSPFGLPNKDYRDQSRDHGRDSTSKDPQVARSDTRGDKDVQKRDYLLKPNVQTDMNSLNNYPDSRLSAEKQRIDLANRSRVDPQKVSSTKHDSMRKHEESKPYLKSETDNIKKHLSASAYDKSNVYLMNKSLTSTSQKIKSPFHVDASKSVPKQNKNEIITHSKPQHYNGSSNDSSYNLPVITNDKIKTDPVYVKEEIPTPSVIKRPSLFSPESTPPHKKAIKSSPSSLKNVTEISTPLSPLTSPVNKRSRNYSSSSEPELRPVMKKIDQVQGFENLVRDNTIGMDKIHHMPDVVTPLSDVKKEYNEVHVPEAYSNDMKPPDIIPLLPTENANMSTLVNGLETNPTLISHLLKEAPSVPHLPVVAASEATAQPVVQPQVQTEVKEKEHHHHKSKKKNKEKHKHKDKDRNREEKKKKHKDKDREKHKHKDKQEIPQPVAAEPIKIKIHKDKIQPLPESSTQGPSIGLKIKIPKDKIKTESISELSQPPPSGGLKIKIPKEKINCGASVDSNSKKRDRDHSSPPDAPPNKVAKGSHKDSKQNGKHSYNKVAQLGDGDASMHRLAESKYTNKSSSS
uniref:Cyclin-T1 n=1 Tax=Anoplophora glabripennis TaxID=217634 RepID=V5GSG4_ANOGL